MAALMVVLLALFRLERDRVLLASSQLLERMVKASETSEAGAVALVFVVLRWAELGQL